MKTIDVYQTDANGFFLYAATASELFLSPGTFNIPYGAVTDAPPKAVMGKAATWDGNAWRMVEDNRSVRLYVARSGAEYQLGSVVNIDGESVTYHGGGPIPDWLTKTQPALSAPILPVE